MKRKQILIILGIILVAAFLRECVFHPDYRILKEYELENGYTLTILSDWSGGPGIRDYYQISSQDQIVVPIAVLTVHAADEKNAYFLYPSRSKNMVALATQREPTEILLLFDTTSQEGWPYSRDGIPASRDIGRILLERMDNLPGNLEYSLGYY